jgi:hypothetical protein
MQQTILQLGIFKKLGTLQSSSRFIDARVCNNEAEEKIGEDIKFFEYTIIHPAISMYCCMMNLAVRVNAKIVIF